MSPDIERQAVLVTFLFSVGCLAGAVYYGWPMVAAWVLGLLMTSAVLRFFSRRG